jgi:hypothetical protein
VSGEYLPNQFRFQENEMLVKEVAEKLGLRILAAGQDQEVTSGYVSDLLSDVIANAEEGCLWITVQRHLNIVAVAQLKKLAGIVLSRGCVPDGAVLARATQEGLFILSTPDDSFTISGKLYALVCAGR